MSKISVTTIAGLTSGGDANKVIIESGDTLQVDSNATVGGTLGVTGDTQLTGNLGVGAAPERKFHVEGSGAEFSLVDTSRPTDKKTMNMFVDANGNGSIRMLNDAQNAGNAAIQITGSSPHTSPAVAIPYQPSFQARSNVTNVNLTTLANGTHHLNYFNAEYFDIGSNYNTTNSTFTAPVAGRYYFYVQLQLNANATSTDHSWGLNLHFQVNSAGNHANGYNSLSTAGAGSLFGQYGLLQKENILNLAANDTVRVAMSVNANVNAGTLETSTNDGRCRFGGHFLG